MAMRRGGGFLLACQAVGQGAVLALKWEASERVGMSSKCLVGGSAPGSRAASSTRLASRCRAQLPQAVATNNGIWEQTGPEIETTTTAAEERVDSPAAAVEGADCLAKAPDRSFKPQGSGGLSYYANMRYFKSRWNPR